jgi:N-acylneuraminate cytidylyltransferase
MASLAIIPARGGSKRIPKKNIKLFLGRPIITYSIETALKSNVFDEVMVSTDDQQIKDIAIKNGAKVPFLRSDENSNDFSTLSDVLIEVLDKYKKHMKFFDYVCCILPTAALLSSEKIIESYKRLIESNSKTIVPVIKFAYPIQRSLKEEQGFLRMREIEHLNTRSQDLEDYYHDSGQFYWLKTKDFLLDEKFFTDKTGYIELKEYEAQDVDTLDDWKMLEIKYKFKP